MKKFLAVLLSALLIGAAALGLSACGGDEGISVYMPDGAPALSMAHMMSEDMQFGKKVKYRVVDASEISSCVTYNDMNKNADICVLPVNDASKLLGDGTKYKMLGTVTHGNLYLVSAGDKTELTAANFATEISGKKVGVMQMAKFPGALFKLILGRYGVANSVTLQGVQPVEVTGVSSDCDYFVVPEPAASTRIGNADLNLKFAGSLQNLYSDGNGYPQAVVVAKCSLLESEPEFISQFMSELASGGEWLLSESVTAETILNVIKAHYADPENTAPVFNANNLTKNVIANCAINFVSSKDCKTQVKIFLTQLKAAASAFAEEVSDNFFYIN